jgi:signal transduction histidine kinase
MLAAGSGGDNRTGQMTAFDLCRLAASTVIAAAARVELCPRYRNRLWISGPTALDLINLLTNALKFTPGDVGSSQLSQRWRSHMVVRDTGEGMDDGR